MLVIILIVIFTLTGEQFHNSCSISTAQFRQVHSLFKVERKDSFLFRMSVSSVIYGPYVFIYTENMLIKTVTFNHSLVDLQIKSCQTCSYRFVLLLHFILYIYHKRPAEFSPHTYVRHVICVYCSF